MFLINHGSLQIDAVMSEFTQSFKNIYIFNMFDFNEMLVK